jgi:catechol 2,3-dioxygenase-like lactoylglutathione lyase family enzyme
VGGGLARLVAMFDAITHTQLWVLDQDEALDFYVGKLGLELHTDAQLEVMRWLTINVPGQPERQLILAVPGPPMHDDATAAQMRELLGKGAFGGAILSTGDCRTTYATLRDCGVEFTQAPEERFYGIDCALRDPFGNWIRITQPAVGPVEPPLGTTARER